MPIRKRSFLRLFPVPVSPCVTLGGMDTCKNSNFRMSLPSARAEACDCHLYIPHQGRVDPSRLLLHFRPTPRRRSDLSVEPSVARVFDGGIITLSLMSRPIRTEITNVPTALQKDGSRAVGPTTINRWLPQSFPQDDNNPPAKKCLAPPSKI